MDQNIPCDTIPKLLYQQERLRPDAIAVRAKSRGIWHVHSWQALARQVRDAAHGLAALGYSRGDRLAVIGDVDPRLFGAMIAAQSLGGVVVPIPGDATPAEIARIVDHAGPRFALVEDREHFDKLLSLRGGGAVLEIVVALKLYEDASAGKVFTYSEMLREGRRLGEDTPNLLTQEIAGGVGGDLATILYEADSEGEPVAVPLTHANWIAAARNTARQLAIGESDEILCLLSPAYAWSLLLYHAVPLFTGARVNFPEAHDTVLTDMREIGPTLCFASPNAYKQIAVRSSRKMEDANWVKRFLFQLATEVRVEQSRPRWLERLLQPVARAVILRPMREVLGMSRIRTALTVSNEIGPEGAAFFRALGLPLIAFYGPSAACGMLTMGGLDDCLQPHMGRPLGDMEVRIGKSREIQFRGSHAAAANGAATDDGWYCSSDAGTIGDGGELRLLGTVAELGALSDGTEFVPRVVEHHLCSSPYVRHAIAFGHGKDFVGALIVIDTDAVATWADRTGVPYSAPAELVTNDDVYQLINRHVGKVNLVLARTAWSRLQVKRFAILHSELDAEAGELTHSRLPRRRVIEKRHADLVNALFGEDDHFAYAARGALEPVKPNGSGRVRIVSLQSAAEVIPHRRPTPLETTLARV